MSGGVVNPVAVDADYLLKVYCPDCEAPVGDPCEDPQGRRLVDPDPNYYPYYEADLYRCDYYGQVVTCHSGRLRHFRSCLENFASRMLVVSAHPRYPGLIPGEVVLGIPHRTRTEYVYLLRRERDGVELDGVMSTTDLELLEFTDEHRAHFTGVPRSP